MNLSVEARRTDHDARGSFGSILRSWRRHRGLSQLDLSLEAGISSRHLSFLETGRSAPSREMVYLLLEALRVPLRERNRILLAAGYAPAYSEISLGDNDMERVRRAIRLLLERHRPFPAYAMDGAWNVVDSNGAFDAFLERLVPAARAEPQNILRLFFAPHLLRPSVVDWEASARAVLLRVRRQLDAPVVPDELSAVVQEVRAYPGVQKLLDAPIDPSGFELFVPISVRVDKTTLRWMTTIVTFAAAVDVTLDDLVVECFFPADPTTESFAESFR